MESIWKRMESMRKKYGIHVEKPWNPSGKPMESIHHSMESIHQKYGIHPPFHGIHPPFHGIHPPFHGIHLEFLQSIPPSMDSTWNNPGRVKYCLCLHMDKLCSMSFASTLLMSCSIQISSIQQYTFEGYHQTEQADGE